MEEKLKAKELVNLYMDLLPYSNNMISIAKKMAKIAVNEIIKSNPIQPLSFMLESEAIDAAVEYWNEVLKEIDNI